MAFKFYALISASIFFLVTLVAQVSGKISIGGSNLTSALNEAALSLLNPISTAFLIAPFIGVAAVCGWIGKNAMPRSANLVFVLALVGMSYFYFKGFVGAEAAMKNERWTAASLSIGLLPFFIGIPAVLGALGAGAVVNSLDPRSTQ